MADQEHNYDHHHQQEDKTINSEEAVPMEAIDRGILDFMKKKDEEKLQEEVIVTEFENVHVSEHEPKVEHMKEEDHKEDEKEKKHGLLEKLQRSDSSSSSSSEEEGQDGETKRKKKKEKGGLKEKIKEKLPGHKKEEKHHEEHEEDTSVPVEKYEEKIHIEEVIHSEATQPEEKKGFFDKIKEKLPGQHKKPEEQSPAPATAPAMEHTTTEAEGEGKEKKGFLEKIKEKIPGFHPKHEEEKEKEREVAST
ncbi:hypothetical protein Ancab_007007 [Ancistrocladus abbreviatus]